MNIIDNMMEHYEMTRASADLFIRAKYGFDWKIEDGIIFYQSREYAYMMTLMLRETLGDIPICACDDDIRVLSGAFYGLKVETLESAVEKFPAGIIVLSGDLYGAMPAMHEVARRVPPHMGARIITHRQLGDFLPVGDRQSKLYDAYRKSSLPASARNQARIKNAYALFQDNLSQTTYLSVLKRYLFSSDAMIPVVNGQSQYFERGIYAHLKDEVVVDCGGFIGDTLAEYLGLKQYKHFKQYTIFEPDKGNVGTIQNYVASLSPQVRERIEVRPQAVGNENKVSHFSAKSDATSLISNEGTETVECVALDSALEHMEPTMIKMDVEGYEAFALYGAKETIARSRPVLIICVYHHNYDLWEIPLLLKKLAPDYHFFLRAYDEHYDYICYAVPPERLAL